MRRVLFVCAVEVILLAAFAVTEKTHWVLAAGARQAAATALAPASTSDISSASSIDVVASNIPARSLAINPLDSRANLYLTNASAPNQVFGLAVADGGVAPRPNLRIAAVAGTGVSGSLGDGGAALAAQLDLTLTAPATSGLWVAADGTLFVADTGNSTIRSIAGSASSEPDIIRSVAGRWAAKQNVALTSPLGIALDHGGNLYIADHGAGSIDVLQLSTGRLEVLVHVYAPSGMALTPNGATLFVASPDTGAVFSIATETRAITTIPGFSPSDSASPCGGQNGAAGTGGGGRQVCPAALAVDGGGNLFIADENSGRILRVDAMTSSTTTVASGFNQPVALAFDHGGNLYVAEQGGINRLLRIEAIGVVQSNLSISPVSAGFGNEPNGGTTGTIPFTVANLSSSAITGLTIPSATSPADFTNKNSSCTAILAANSSCTVNIAFTPTATGARSAAYNVTDSVPTDLASASMSGTGDDYELALGNGQLQQMTVPAGGSITYNLQVTADTVFNGLVTITCPTNLPINTTCTGPAAPLNVSPGQSVSFQMSFQTTGVINPLSTAAPGSPKSWRDGPNFPSRLLLGLLAGLILTLLFASSFGRSANFPRALKWRLAPGWALLIVVVAILAGCHRKNTAASLGATPPGISTLAVAGTSQNAVRSVTILLDVVVQY